MIELGELAGQHQPEFRAHFVTQTTVTLGLRRLPLQRIHLPRHFLENVIYAGEILLGVFQSRFGETLLGFELGDSCRFFDDRSTVGWTAAQDLPNASLFDERVGFWPEASAHEQFLNIAQTAEFSVQQIFAVSGTKKASRDDNFSSAKLLLKFPAADFEHNLLSRWFWGGRNAR